MTHKILEKLLKITPILAGLYAAVLFWTIILTFTFVSAILFGEKGTVIGAIIGTIFSVINYILQMIFVKNKSPVVTSLKPLLPKNKRS